jgi:hypothetical protein
MGNHSLSAAMTLKHNFAKELGNHTAISRAFHLQLISVGNLAISVLFFVRKSCLKYFKSEDELEKSLNIHVI